MSGALKGTSTGWTWAWVTDPPVLSVTKGVALQTAVNAMREIVGGFSTGELAATNKAGDELDDAVKWNRRFTDAKSILDLVKQGQDTNFVYYLFGKPVGIICIIDSDPPYIAEVVTHPGVENAGGILIEAAATHSQKRGQRGHLKLYSYSDASTKAYLALGFKKIDDTLSDSGDMTLNPGASDLWVPLGGKWRLMKYQAAKYYTVRPALPPKKAKG